LNPTGQSKRVYLDIVTLVGLAFASLSNILSFELQLELFPWFSDPRAGGQLAVLVTFLIFPCLFFATLYFYGKRTTSQFSEGYLMVVPLLFIGSTLGFALFLASIPTLESRAVVQDGAYWLQNALSMVSKGLEYAFAGFAALSLAHLRARVPAAGSAHSQARPPHQTSCSVAPRTWPPLLRSPRLNCGLPELVPDPAAVPLMAEGHRPFGPYGPAGPAGDARDVVEPQLRGGHILPGLGGCLPPHPLVHLARP